MTRPTSPLSLQAFEFDGPGGDLNQARQRYALTTSLFESVGDAEDLKRLIDLRHSKCFALHEQKSCSSMTC